MVILGLQKELATTYKNQCTFLNLQSFKHVFYLKEVRNFSTWFKVPLSNIEASNLGQSQGYQHQVSRYKMSFKCGNVELHSSQAGLPQLKNL